MAETVRMTGKNGEFQAHKSAYVDEGCEVGKDTKIWHFCHIQSGAKIGEECSIGQNVNVGSKAVLGNRVKVQNNVSIYDDVIIEDDAFCGPSCVFTNVINPRSFIVRKNEYRTTLVKKGSTIGANATIVCGVTLGKYSFVGAGSVVTKNVPDYALVFGNPAVFKAWMCRCGNKLNGDLVCPVCGKKYSKTESGIEEIE